MTVFDETVCVLGEGPLWHPQNGTLYWFDIMGKKLFTKDENGVQDVPFETHHSAAGWVDDTTLLIASETALSRFDTATGSKTLVCALEADNAVTRSNDGRADPWGGFWIGSMGKSAEPKAGAIWRYHRGELRKLVPDVTIANAICFAPDKSCAYYTDTVTQQIMRQPLQAEDGWPTGRAEVLIDLRERRLNPDGAVTDADGNIWCAMWGAACVVCFAPDGAELRRIEVPARQPTCPAFGGPELRDLYVTSASHDLGDTEIAARPHNGKTFIFRDVAQGQPEPRVLL